MCDTWYFTVLGDGITAIQPQARIESLFNRHHADAGYPADMAVFTAEESEGHLHCKVVAYFTPAAAALAGEVGATPCPRPAPQGLGLVAGLDAAWDAVFPRSGQ